MKRSLFTGITCALLAAAFSCASASAQQADASSLIAQIDKAEQHREADLAGYTVEERYTITNSHFNDPAVAVVKVTYARATGKRYDVISRTGPSLLANKLLNSIIDNEEKLSHNPSRSHALLTSANYTMQHTGSETIGGRPCEVLTITPKQQSSYVLNGSIWVDAQSKMIVRVTGTPPVSPSFFAGKSTITRDYGETGGFALALSSHATSSAFFGGNTVVDIVYSHYQLASEK